MNSPTHGKRYSGRPTARIDLTKKDNFARCIVCGEQLATGWNENFSKYQTCRNENCIKYEGKNNRMPKIAKN